MCVSTITLAELYYGIEKSSRRAQNLRVVEEFVARLEALPFSIEAAAHYGQVRAELERAGRVAGPHDMLIGAHARSAGLIVVTNNVREFERIPGLRIENWV
jgi:tRNA(fMet)-specific endonuclease VapC